MGIAAGPNISRDGLVLFYDFSNIKSFRGEPTTNLVNPSWSSWGVDSSGFSTLGTRILINNYHCKIIDTNSNTRQSIYINGISPSTTYTFSVQFKRITPGSPSLRFQIQYYNSGTYISIDFPLPSQLGLVSSPNWQTAKYTITTPPNTNRILWFMQDGNDYVGYTHEFELKEVQLEMKSYDTNFVDGTRGTTVATGGGIIDLSTLGNNAELVNGIIASSDLGGSVDFDGVNDYLDMGTYVLFSNGSIVPINNPSLQLSNNFTICFWHKNANTGYILDQGNIGEDPTGSLELTNRGLTLGANNLSSVSADGSLDNTVPNFVSVSYASSITKFYINGNLDSTKNTSFSNFSPSGVLKIGRRAFSGSSAFSGKIYYASIYNKVLTDSQIKDLYNATRSRFITRQNIVYSTTKGISDLVLNLDASNRDSYKGTGTTWNDLSGFGNNGTLTNGPLLKNGNGGSFLFDGINDSVSTNLTGTITNLTVECWYRGTSTARSHLWNFGIYTGSNDTNLNFNFNDGYDLWVFWESGGLNRVRYNIDGSFTDNTIKCLVFTHTGSTNKVYLNGTELTITESGGNQAFTNVNGTGAFNLAGTIPFKGNIYNARVYKRALSAAEVLQNFNATKSRFGL